MAEQQKQSLCPRLIDYLAIVGAKNSPVRTSGTNNNQPPVQVSFLCDLIFILFHITVRKSFSCWTKSEKVSMT